MSELRAVIESASGGGGRLPPLIPDRHEPRQPVGIEKIRVREVESADVDDAEQHARAASVRLRIPHGLLDRRGGAAALRLVEFQRIGRVHEGHRGIAGQRVEQ